MSPHDKQQPKVFSNEEEAMKYLSKSRNQEIANESFVTKDKNRKKK
ncbi:hypothetical protein [Oceanobacillus piezotolerans]|nr:hypothetical protein [Oceanobacillus piezotolerans]